MSSPTRRLTTVWFADIAGFTRLSATDEPLALRAMASMRQCVRAAVAAERGDIIKWMGDGVLAEFPSAEGAVEAALEAQARFKGGTRELAGGPFPLNIGIHVGDVTESGDGEKDIFGDGVNRASRLQSLGSGGQVLVSEDVYRLVRRRPELQFESLGEKTAKGLDEPFEVFAVAPAGALIERLAQMEADPANKAPDKVQARRAPRVAKTPTSRGIGAGIAAGVVAFIGLALYTAMGGDAVPPVQTAPIPDTLPIPVRVASFAMPAWPPPRAEAAAPAPSPTTLAGLTRRGETFLGRLDGRDFRAHEVLPLVRHALNEARDGAPVGPRADAIRGVILFAVEQNLPRAESAFQSAIAVDPRGGLTMLMYAQLLSAQGRTTEALYQIQQARGKGVGNAVHDAVRGAVLFRDGQYRQAQGPLEDALDDEDLPATRILLARALIAQNKTGDALKLLEKDLASVELMPWRAYARLRAARERNNPAERARILQMAGRVDVGYAGAILMHEAGETQRAYTVLDRLIRARDPDLLWLAVDPEWQSVREDSRFRQRVDRVIGES